LRQRSGKVDKRFIEVVAILVQHAPYRQQIGRHGLIEWSDNGIGIAYIAGITTGLCHLKVSKRKRCCSGGVTGGFTSAPT
jgi:hypothetical protein